MAAFGHCERTDDPGAVYEVDGEEPDKGGQDLAAGCYMHGKYQAREEGTDRDGNEDSVSDIGKLILENPDLQDVRLVRNRGAPRLLHVLHSGSSNLNATGQSTGACPKMPTVFSLEKV